MHPFRRVSAVLALTLAAAATQAAPPSTAFTYQGELKDNGQLVEATLPMTFRLFNAPSGGTLLATVSKAAVSVQQGRFTEPLDFPIATLNGSQGLWLEVQVSGVTLAQRQQITGAAYSLSTRGITVDAQNRVGIGTATPSRRLTVMGGMEVFDTAQESISLHSDLFRLASGTGPGDVYKYEYPADKHTWSTADEDRMGTTSPQGMLHIFGPMGDSTVILPGSAINALETANEPGIASASPANMSFSSFATEPIVVATRTIDAPTNGYLLVMGTNYGIMAPLASVAVEMLVDGVAHGGADVYSNGNAQDRIGMSSMRVIPVNAGQHTVTWQGQATSASCIVHNPSLVVMFFPTAYGSVE
jgi:hypothetical protein